MLKKVVLIILSAGLIIGSTLGCSGEAEEESTSTTSEEEAYSIKIYLNGTLTRSITLAEIDALEKSGEGPTLLDVLELAGIEEFSRITVVGMSQGRVASAELVLTRDQIDDTVILGITNRGTTKLAGLNIPRNDWIIDVGEMRIE